MKTKQKNKLRMYLAVADVLEKNISKWTGINEIRNTIDEITANNKKIIELINEEEKDIDPVISDKSTSRQNLINKVVPVCNILQVYAYDTSNKGLAKKINFSRNKLTKLKDSVLINRSRKIWKGAKQIYGASLDSTDELLAKNKKPKSELKNIKAYGLNGQMIDDLDEANKLYVDIILTVKDAVTYRNNCTKKITTKVKQNDRLLRNKLDKLLTLFEISDSSFYKAYKEARVINSGENKTKTAEELPKTEGQKPAVTVVEKEEKAVDTQSRKSGTVKKTVIQKRTGTPTGRTTRRQAKPPEKK